MQIIPLSEGAFTIDKSKRFVPFDTATDDLQQRPIGSLLVEVQPFALITSEDIIVIDTGLGFQKDGQLQLHYNLRQAGIEPEKVTKVLMSHLHKDHAGGISGDRSAASAEREGAASAEVAQSRAGGGSTAAAQAAFSPSALSTGEPAFAGAQASGGLSVHPSALALPNATYYVQRRELDYAFEKGPTSYMPDELGILKTSPKVVFLDNDQGIIEGYIRYEVTGAHCPWHQAFWIVDGGETAFFGGDVAPQLQQMKSRFIAKYDYDGKKAMAYRQEWWQRGQQDGWTFLFYHDVQTPVFSWK